MTPEELLKAEAKQIADFYFPRTRSSREALEGDIFRMTQKAVETAFAAGLEMGVNQSGKPLVVQVDGKDAAELEKLRANTCACCGDGLLPGPPPLCERCAPSYTNYGTDGAFCEHHEPALTTNAIEAWKNEHADEVTAATRAEAPNPIGPR